MDDETPVIDLKLKHIKFMMRDVSKDYFKSAVKETCQEINADCRHQWNKDLYEIGEKMTGLDISSAESKDHIRGVYKFAESLKNDSGTLRTKIIQNFVQWAFIALAIYLGLK